MFDHRELETHLAHLSNSHVIRTLLLTEIHGIKHGSSRPQRTMRGLWYHMIIKPALSRAGLLNKKTSTERGGKGKAVDWAQILSRVLGDLVDDGLTSYEQMNIIDGSRQRSTAGDIIKYIANVQIVGGHFPWVILFIEKDTVWPTVVPTSF